MTTFNDVRDILRTTLQLGERADGFTGGTPLLDSVPEFDSMAVVTVITAIEEHFATVGSLVGFVQTKLQPELAR